MFPQMDVVALVIAMWTCTNCSESLEDQFNACWKCGCSRDGRLNPTFRVETNICDDLPPDQELTDGRFADGSGKSHDGASRPWLLRPWCVKLSVTLFIISEIEAVAAIVVAFATGNKNAAVWGVPFVFVGLYLGAFGIIYLAALDDQHDLTSRRRALSWFPRVMSAVYPKWFTHLLGVCIQFHEVVEPTFVNAVLIACPLFLSLAGGGVLWAAISGQLNP